ncbi:L,D-transpeptidase family protein [Roseomonas sp. OT10]|uniref:L,D-transpeptidase family protein n=1 Tax=Roseomonas cutis TaxID=2897332 RepID=UPI001E3491AD|nr:L,D-transpeptidase family protein [Roseomonas sp. OT10]UFN47336.1 L,D-transpeptidase family protein [Roseomonas sp. OT10]
MRRRDLCLALTAGAAPLPGTVRDTLAQRLPPPVPPSPAPYPAEALAARDPATLRRLADRLRRLEEDGLDPAAYALPADALALTDPRGFAEGMQRAASAALSDLLLGRLRLPASRPDILRDPAAVPLPRWQAELASAPDPAAVIDRAARRHPDAPALKAALAGARALVAAGGWQPIPATGGTIEPGSTDPARVPALRARLRAEDPALAAAPDAGELYDDALLDVVRRWQEANGLEADGRVGALTLAALNRPAEARVDQLRVALDMRRAAATPPAGPRVEVNIPDFTLRVVDGPRVLLRMNVVVGRPSRATPLLRVRMTTVQFNPPWGVPERNARQDLLPKFRRDPRGMAAKGFRLYTVVGGERVEVDPATVDWASMTPTNFPYFIRQDAGDANALGRLKFIMPNNDDIYLHDTPERALFNRPDRAFSSGCIRLERPMELLDIALDGMGWDRARSQQIFDSKQTRFVPLKRSLPVNLHYTTAVVEEGRVRLRPDIYGLDAAYAREMDRIATARIAAR